MVRLDSVKQRSMISSEIGARDHPQALAKGEAEIRVIRRVLGSDFYERTVLDLRGEEAERFMEQLRLVVCSSRSCQAGPTHSVN